ncbi:MAG: ATP-dependent helicase HrpB [Bacteroidetes bacterium]|nr:ATP-dependent helicase HrpB [Bacteroidota bacterium]
MKSFQQKLPIHDALPELENAFNQNTNLILSAPPGAGKTTQVPIALLSSGWLKGKKIIMLEPRRLAARRAAEYMSAQLGEKTGQTVGFRIRGESAVSKQTRIEVVTEGILTRMLQQEPELPGTGIVIFDEFHERSIHADLGLALTIDVQKHLRNDLRILIMSATLDGVRITRLFSDAKNIESKGKSFPVTTHYAGFVSDKPVETRIADAIRRALSENEGDILVFLPGRREINRVENLLWEKRLPEDVIVHSLFGDASYRQQSAALSPAPAGKRKIILSTSIAETSLTIDGVCIVIDSGLARTARFDVRRGMSGLVTIPASKAVADQRRGRAGRQQPGVCYRLWSEMDHETLPDYPQPEIMIADLAPLALDFALWGAPNGENLQFLDPPPAPHLLQAQSLLKELGAIDSLGKITKHGRAMAELPLHPRLSHMILRGKEIGAGSLACDIAALLDERDIFSSKKDTDIDLASRLHFLNEKQKSKDGVIERVISQSRRLRQITDIHQSNEKSENAAGILLALAYPERTARQRDAKNGRYQMASGTAAVLPKGSLLAREEFLAIGEVDGIGAEVRIYLAALITKQDIENVFSDSIKEEEEIRWNSADEAVIARKIRHLGAIILTEQPIKPQGDKIISAMVEGIKQMGIDCLPWDKDTRSLQQRCEWLRADMPNIQLPDLSDTHLINTIDEWLAPFLNGIWRKDQIASLPLLKILQSHITKPLVHQIDTLAPSHLKLPSGSVAMLDYSGTQPVLAVRLQELFGQLETPSICNGKIKVLIHLLSPARRPLAVTKDLHSFWTKTYPEIRTQMRAQYPKHIWPEDPLNAKPTNKTIRKKK